jgi:hypothetical protein
VAELGANFIHGTEGNPLTSIAKNVGATLIPSHRLELRRYYGPNGEQTETKESAFIYEKVWEYSDAAVEYSRENNVASNKSMLDFCNTRLAEDPDLKTDELKRLIASGVDMLGDIAACDLDKMSLRYYWMEQDLPVHLVQMVLQ